MNVTRRTTGLAFHRPLTYRGTSYDVSDPIGEDWEKNYLGWRLATQDRSNARSLRSITSSKALEKTIGEKETQ
jgi:hypothetical protein